MTQEVNRICSLCGADEIEDFTTVSDRILYHRCRNCSYISRDEAHRLSADDEKKRYQLHNNSPDNPGYVEWINRFLDFIFKSPLPGGRLILDFGSGPEPVMAGMMENLGYRVFTEDPFFSPEKPGGCFQLITSLEVFEHLQNPYETLVHLASRLTENGRLCISTEFIPDDMGRFEYWRYRSDETHIGLFTADGLIKAGEKAGFEMEDCDGTRYISFRLAQRGRSC